MAGSCVLALALAHRAATWSAPAPPVGARPLTAARKVSLSSANRVAVLWL